MEEKNTLFDDLSKNLENNEGLREFVRMVLIDGITKTTILLGIASIDESWG